MAYVGRDSGGKVKGVFHLRQPGYAEEFLADNHPDVLAFINRAPDKAGPPLTVEELAAQMIKDGTMTQAKIDAIKAAR